MHLAPLCLMPTHAGPPGPARPAATPWRLLGMAVLALALAGCSTLRGTPQRFAATDEVVKAIDLTPADVAQLVSATTEGERNALQRQAIAVIDLQFHQFVRDLAADRADAAAGVAGTTLVASTAGAFVQSVKAKTNYALFAAGTVGAFGIVDKSYFYEKTVPALVAAMKAARAKVLLSMRTGQGQTISLYDGTAALADLEDYYSAGSVLVAISEITASAEATQQQASVKIRALTAMSDDEIGRWRKVTKSIWAVKDAAALPKANLALKALSLPEEASPQAAKAALLRFKSAESADRLTTMENALRTAGLLLP